MIRVEIPVSSSLFAGHFPGHPILPGIAHLALAERALREITGQDVSLAGVRNLKLRRPVSPGDILEIRIGSPDEEGTVRFEVRCNGEVASQGTVQVRTGSTGEADGDFGAADAPVAGFPPPETLLPHAPPARLLRAIVEATDVAVVAIAEVSPSHPLVTDGRLPTFLALEAAAQAAAALEALGRREAPGPRMGYLVGIRDARFAVPSLPAGRLLRVAARLEGGAFPLSVYAVTVGEAEREIATGIISTFLLTAP
ncbi:MAG: 3-hydroxyacyl-[acyl-carrier-protein] dehydratase [Acidobacteriota bacterium]|jgi:predicted hotdog family 3-hydroxylacyl-ACP dehydratase|nr:3-hydroxyacyl-[acyl-carrier-protein] dehydratase [Acidobacteriota bacterium]